MCLIFWKRPRLKLPFLVVLNTPTLHITSLYLLPCISAQFFIVSLILYSCTILYCTVSPIMYLCTVLPCLFYHVSLHSTSLYILSCITAQYFPVYSILYLCRVLPCIYSPPSLLSQYLLSLGLLWTKGNLSLSPSDSGGSKVATTFYIQKTTIKSGTFFEGCIPG